MPRAVTPGVCERAEYVDACVRACVRLVTGQTGASAREVLRFAQLRLDLRDRRSRSAEPECEHVDGALSSRRGAGLQLKRVEERRRRGGGDLASPIKKKALIEDD